MQVKLEVPGPARLNTYTAYYVMWGGVDPYGEASGKSSGKENQGGKEHTKNKRKSNHDKHTKQRSGRHTTKQRSHKNWRQKGAVRTSPRAMGAATLATVVLSIPGDTYTPDNYWYYEDYVNCSQLIEEGETMCKYMCFIEKWLIKDDGSEEFFIGYRGYKEEDKPYAKEIGRYAQPIMLNKDENCECPEGPYYYVNNPDYGDGYINLGHRTPESYYQRNKTPFASDKRYEN